MVIPYLTMMVTMLCLWAGGVGPQTPPQKSTRSLTECYYRFESPSFEIQEAEIRFDHNRQGTLAFRRKNEEPVEFQITLLPETLNRIEKLLDEARFFESGEDYQGGRDMSHLGTTTIRVRQATEERQVTFNYTRHPQMRALADLLRHIVTQESRVFSIQLTRQFEPLGLDRQLTGLMREVRNGWIAEPRKLIPLLEALESDEDLLLIARRQARELLHLIRKKR